MEGPYDAEPAPDGGACGRSVSVLRRRRPPLARQRLGPGGAGGRDGLHDRVRARDARGGRVANHHARHRRPARAALAGRARRARPPRHARAGQHVALCAVARAARPAGRSDGLSRLAGRAPRGGPGRVAILELRRPGGADRPAPACRHRAQDRARRPALRSGPDSRPLGHLAPGRHAPAAHRLRGRPRAPGRDRRPAPARRPPPHGHGLRRRAARPARRHLAIGTLAAAARQARGSGLGALRGHARGAHGRPPAGACLDGLELLVLLLHRGDRGRHDAQPGPHGRAPVAVARLGLPARRRLPDGHR
ncbi:hypothetical protein D3C72_916320 [compost metagenome]